MVDFGVAHLVAFALAILAYRVLRRVKYGH